VMFFVSVMCFLSMMFLDSMNFFEFMDFHNDLADFFDNFCAVFCDMFLAYFVLFAKSDDLVQFLVSHFLVSSFELFLGVFLNFLERFLHNRFDFFVAFLESSSCLSMANKFGDFVARSSDDFLELFLLMFESFLLEMFSHFGDFHNINFDLCLFDSLDDFLGMFFDFFFATSSGVFSNLADLLDEIIGFLLHFIVFAQTSLVAHFHITGLAISDGFGSIAAGGAVMICFDMACTRFQSLFAVFLDFLVEFVDCF